MYILFKVVMPANRLRVNHYDLHHYDLLNRINLRINVLNRILHYVMIYPLSTVDLFRPTRSKRRVKWTSTSRPAKRDAPTLIWRCSTFTTIPND